MKRLGSVLAAVLVFALVTPAHATASGSSWLMEETSGTVMLDSLGTNNGALHGVALGQPGRPGSSGVRSYGFDGTTSYVVVPNNTSLNPGTQDFTFTAALKLSGTPGIGNLDYDIIRKGGGWKMEAYPHNGVVTAQCVYSGSTKVNIHAAQVNGVGLDDHAWHVITCARSASGETLTVDGSVVATSSVQVGAVTNTSDVYLGAQEAGVDFYAGLMDDVSFTVGPATPPTITSFSPPSGPVGTSVTINGTNFSGASDVRFNGLSVGVGNFIVNSSVLITATVPSGATNGVITVITPGGSANSASSFTVTPPLPPTITGFSPPSGQVGTSVTINGTNFSGASDVRFNGLSVGVGNFIVNSSTLITATVPAGATDGLITVVAPGGTVDSASSFTVTPPPSPTITGFSPPSGPIGTSVTINGTNFTGASDVRFNGLSVGVGNFIVNSSVLITATVPSGATNGLITVVAPGGSADSPTSFTVTPPPPPTITSFSPPSAAVGTAVTINGTNFTGASDVRFNGLSVGVGNFTVNSNSLIAATVPVGATNGPITVVTPGGSADSPTSFTVAPPIPNAPDPGTYGVNGRVSALVRIGNIVIIGGTFTAAVAPNGTMVARHNLAAIDTTTGQLTSFAPEPNGEIDALATDGSQLFVGGTFSTISGQPRHGFAAYSSALTLRPWTLDVSGSSASVGAFAIAGSTLYLGGNFSTVSGLARKRLASVNLAANPPAVLPWAPSADKGVRAIAPLSNGDVVVGGVFSTLNGVPNAFLGEIRPDGSVAPWASHPEAQVWFVIPSASGNSVFVAAGGIVPEGEAQSYAPGGTLLWATNTDGGVQAVAWDATDGVVIFGGHFRQVAGVAVPRLCALDPNTGALDTAWVPSPNSSKGVWAVYASPDKLYAGGDFTTMGTSTFNHFAQFSI